MSLSVVREDITPARNRRWKDIGEVVTALRRRHRNYSQGQLAELLAERLDEDRALLLQAGKFIVGHVLGDETRPRKATQSGKERAQRRVEEKVAVQQIVQQVKAVAVLDMVLTTVAGEAKTLRFTTGKELSELGGGFARIAERIGRDSDTMVGMVLCEIEAASLLRG